MPFVFGEAKKLCGSPHASYSWRRATQFVCATTIRGRSRRRLRGYEIPWRKHWEGGEIRGLSASSVEIDEICYGYFRRRVGTYAVASSESVFEKDEAKLEFERTMPSFFIRLRRVLG